MAEVLVIGGLGLIGSILVQSGSSLAAIGIIYKARNVISRYTTYKIRTRKAKKMIKQGIKILNYDLFKKGFERLKFIDDKFDSTVYMEYLKKYNLTNEIVDNKILFNMKFDGEYLVKKYNISSNMSPNENMYNDLMEEKMEEIENQKRKLGNLIENYESKSESNILNKDILIRQETLGKKEEYIEECIKKLYQF